MLNERTVIVNYFLILILLGACLLMVPGIWLGSNRFIDDIETKPSKIIVNIVATALIIETAGALLLYFAFYKAGLRDKLLFTSVFHSVSAFCNAGFSLFPDNLERFVGNPEVSLVVSGLVIVGGIGFVVINDVSRRVRNPLHLVMTHTKIVRGATAVLLFAGTVFFYMAESRGAYRSMTFPQKAVAAFFLSVTCRTAGFDTVPQYAFSRVSTIFATFL